MTEFERKTQNQDTPFTRSKGFDSPTGVRYPRVVLLRIMLSSFTSRFAATSSFSSFVSRVYSASSFFAPVRLSVLAAGCLNPQEIEPGIIWEGARTLGIGDNQTHFARGEQNGDILESYEP